MTPNGLAILKRLEGLRLTAYRDGGGVLTIGYGHTGKDVAEGRVITAEDADELLRDDVAEAETVFNSVTTSLNPNQRDAITCLVFNIGKAAFKGSTLLRTLNAGDTEGAAEQFGRWVYDDGKVVEGLVRRRAVEEELFRRPVKPLAASRTMVGGTAATVGAAGATVTGAIQQAVDVLSPIVPYVKWAGIVLGVLAVAGALYVLYSRWDDARHGRH